MRNPNTSYGFDSFNRGVYEEPVEDGREYAFNDCFEPTNTATNNLIENAITADSLSGSSITATNTRGAFSSCYHTMPIVQGTSSSCYRSMPVYRGVTRTLTNSLNNIYRAFKYNRADFRALRV